MPKRIKTGGRPRLELTEEERAQVEEQAAVLTQKQIAAYLGLSYTTFQQRLREDSDLSERYKKGKARAIADVGRSLLSEAMDDPCTHCGRGGNLTAKIFYLKTQAKWSERVEVSEGGPDGQPRIPLDIVPALAALTGLQPEDFDLSKLRNDPPVNGSRKPEKKRGL